MEPFVLHSLAAPAGNYDSMLHVFESVLEQEQEVTRQIDSLYELAFKEKSFAALVELEWFITEQVEEEKSAREILHKFRMVGDDPASLLDLDQKLGERAGEEAGA